jgi:glycosyltransferase involved in cell wall biosynthesis
LGHAIARLNSEGCRAIGLVVGDAEAVYLRWLEANFPFLSFVGGAAHENLPTFYAAADAAAWPTQESMSIFEAMAMALPVAVSAGTGVSRIVETAHAGCSFSGNDANELAAVLSAFKGEAGQRLGSQGRMYAEANLSWNKRAARYEELYRETVVNRAARHGRDPRSA